MIEETADLFHLPYEVAFIVAKHDRYSMAKLLDCL